MNYPLIVTYVFAEPGNFALSKDKMVNEQQDIAAKAYEDERLGKCIKHI